MGDFDLPAIHCAGSSFGTDELEMVQPPGDLTWRIKAYFVEHDGEALYPSDVAEALGLDYDLVVGTIEALAEEGKIAQSGAVK